MSIHIITDSSADLTPADAQRLGVEVVSMSIQFGDRSYLDGIDLDKAQFYQLLAEDKTSPSTAQPTPADFLKPMEAARATGAEAVVITLSSILSGTHQSALIAKDMCSYGPIYVVDSLSATAGIQIMVEYACKLREQGLSAQEIAEQVETLKGRIRIFAVIDTLEYLRRGAVLSPGRPWHRDQAQTCHRRPGWGGHGGGESLWHRSRHQAAFKISLRASHR